MANLTRESMEICQPRSDRNRTGVDKINTELTLRPVKNKGIMPGKVQKKGRRKIQKTQDSTEGNVNQDTVKGHQYGEIKKRKIEDNTTENQIKDTDLATIDLSEQQDHKGNPDVEMKDVDETLDKKKAKEETNDSQIKDGNTLSLCEDQEVNINPATEGQGHMRSNIISEDNQQNLPDKLNPIAEESGMDARNNPDNPNENKQRNLDIDTKDQSRLTEDNNISKTLLPVHLQKENKTTSPGFCNSHELFENKEAVPNKPSNEDCVTKGKTVAEPSGVETNEEKQENVVAAIKVNDKENVHNPATAPVVLQPVNKDEGQGHTTSLTANLQPLTNQNEVQGQADKVKVTMEDNPDVTLTSPSLPVGAVVPVDDSKTEDITDSQLCALEWMSQFPDEISCTIPDQDKMVVDKSDRESRECEQIEDGSAIMTGFIRELSQLNKMVLKTKREIEAARRQRKQTSSK